MRQSSQDDEDEQEPKQTKKPIQRNTPVYGTKANPDSLGINKRKSGATSHLEPRKTLTPDEKFAQDVYREEFLSGIDWELF